MFRQDDDTERLVEQAGRGDRSAADRLLMQHRDRLKQMVAFRMDPRLSARVDPSDVVQEALMDAHRRLDEYLKHRPLPFYPWLRQIACDRLIDLRRRHVEAQRRTVRREQDWAWDLSDRSVMELADRLIASGTNPSGNLQREELVSRVRAAMARMRPSDREVLAMRHLEQMSSGEIAAVLGITEGTFRVRHLRALERLQGFLSEESSWTEP